MRYIFIVAFCFLVSGCSSMGSSPENQMAAAKINIQLGLSYLEAHETDRAKSKLLMALDEAPHLPEAQVAMGYFLWQTGQINEAKKYYDRALKLAPKSGQVQNNVAVFLCETGAHKEAMNYFEKAMQDPRYLNEKALYQNAAICAAKIPDKARATYYLRRAQAYH